ncbi:MAG: hypothetical protein LH702_21500 [Phormidesmis sp. CAN_BIN44]|nr:hypothetical protein [Phormidesmis sp. CAN_BIN44]
MLGEGFRSPWHCFARIPTQPLEEARRQGRVGGRRPKLTQPQQQAIIQMVNGEQKSSAEAARLFKVHPSTVSRLLSQHRHASARTLS